MKNVHVLVRKCRTCDEEYIEILKVYTSIDKAKEDLKKAFDEECECILSDGLEILNEEESYVSEDGMEGLICDESYELMITYDIEEVEEE